MKILIIGGSGELGSQILKACQLGNYDISVSSRSPKANQVQFDWLRAETFVSLTPFDVVINTAPVSDFEGYFKLINDLLAQQKTILETTAAADFVAEIIRFQHKSINQQSGLYLHGVGLFPGISNFLCKLALEKHPDAKSIHFNIKYSIFSKAGKDMCQLMAESLSKPSVYFENGTLKTAKPIGPNHAFGYQNKQWKGFLAELPDTFYFNQIAPKLQFIGSYFTPLGAALYPFVGLFNFLPTAPTFVKMYAACFYFMRGKIFKNKQSEMLISLVIDQKYSFRLHTPAALYAAGLGVAALLPLLTNQRGVLRADQAIGHTDFFTSLSKTDPAGIQLLG